LLLARLLLLLLLQYVFKLLLLVFTSEQRRLHQLMRLFLLLPLLLLLLRLLAGSMFHLVPFSLSSPSTQLLVVLHDHCLLLLLLPREHCAPAGAVVLSSAAGLWRLKAWQEWQLGMPLGSANMW